MSEEENYLTISQNGCHELLIKKSRFIATFARTKSVDEAKAFIQQINKKYHDASHNTYAYTIGVTNCQVKASDNGEPAGTAGVPELRALELMQLKNVTVVVTRYFGGIKLGAGGLIRAYSSSVSQGAKAIGIVKRVLQQEIIFSVPYHRYDGVQHFLQEHKIDIADTEYAADVTIHVFLDLNALNEFQKQMENLLSGNFHPHQGKKAYREIKKA